MRVIVVGEKRGQLSLFYRTRASSRSVLEHPVFPCQRGGSQRGIRGLLQWAGDATPSSHVSGAQHTQGGGGGKPAKCDTRV